MNPLRCYCPFLIFHFLCHYFFHFLDCPFHCWVVQPQSHFRVLLALSRVVLPGSLHLLALSYLLHPLGRYQNRLSLLMSDRFLSPLLSVLIQYLAHWSPENFLLRHWFH